MATAHYKISWWGNRNCLRNLMRNCFPSTDIYWAKSLGSTCNSTHHSSVLFLELQQRKSRTDICIFDQCCWRNFSKRIVLQSPQRGRATSWQYGPLRRAGMFLAAIGQKRVEVWRSVAKQRLLRNCPSPLPTPKRIEKKRPRLSSEVDKKSEAGRLMWAQIR